MDDKYLPRQYIMSKLAEAVDMSQIQQLKLAALGSGDVLPPDLELFYIDVDLLFIEKEYDKLLQMAAKLPAPDTESKVKVRLLDEDKIITYSELCERMHSFPKNGIKSLEDYFAAQLEWIQKYTAIIAPNMELTVDLFEQYNHIRTVESYLQHAACQYFRLTSGMYWVRRKEGGLTPFILNPQQRIVYREVILEHPRIILLKSRQTGASTLFLMKALDDITTRSHFESGLQAQGKLEAKSLKERVRLAWDKIPPLFKEAVEAEVETDNAEEFKLTKGSKLRVAVSFRSATLNALHVSEVGKISEASPEKAKELELGTLQAIKPGQQVVFESTAEGMDNYFYDKWQSASDSLQKVHFNKDMLSGEEFSPVFLSLWDDPDCYIEPTEAMWEKAKSEMYSEVTEFFETSVVKYEEITGRKLVLKKGQKLFWWEKFKSFGFDWDKMGQEYPDIPESAFAAGKDGSYYSQILYKEVKLKGQICDGVYDPNLPTYAAFDLGMNDTMVCIWFQVFKKEIRIIDVYGNSGEPISHYTDKLKSKPYKVTRVFLPHDVQVRELATGKTRLQAFRSAGLYCTVLPKVKVVVDEIELVRRLLPNCWFEYKTTSILLKYLAKYRKEYDEKHSVFKNSPLHDESSNWADSFRYVISAAHRYLHVRPKMENITRVKPAKNVYDGLAI